MMTFGNNYERISFLASLMSNARKELYGREFTIRTISERFQYPIAVLRKDIAFLMGQPLFEHIVIESDEDNDDPVKALLDGKYDDTNIVLGNDAFIADEETYLVYLTKTEETIAGQWFSEKEPLYVRKEVPTRPSKQYENKLNIINNAILNNNAIQFNGLKGHTFIKPIDLRTDASNPENAKCIDSSGIIFSVSKMDNIEEIRSEKASDKQMLFDDDWDAVWSLPSEKGTKEATTQRMILRIFAGTSNLMEKFQSDVSRRKNGNIREEKEGIYIYEDEVSGFDGVRKWLWKYGSSVQVLEPEWFAERVRSDFEKMKNQYRKMKFE